MTVGIGTICHGGSLILMAADTKGTYVNQSLGPNEYVGKQYDLPMNFEVNIAGAVNLCNSVVAFLHEKMKSLQEMPKIYHDHIRLAIRDAQIAEIDFLMDYALMNELGMTRLEWMNAWPKNPRLRRAGRAVFKMIRFQLELTVAGFLNDHHVLLTAIGRNPAETEIRFSVIGTGWKAAQQQLDRRGQNPWTGISRTIVHATEALALAKSESPDSVGDPADYCIISRRGHTYRLPEEFAKQFTARFSGLETEPLDHDNAALQEVRDACYTHVPQEAMIGGERPKTLADIRPSVPSKVITDASGRIGHPSFDD